MIQPIISFNSFPGWITYLFYVHKHTQKPWYIWCCTCGCLVVKTHHFTYSTQIKYFFIFLQNFAVRVKFIFLTSTSLSGSISQCVQISLTTAMAVELQEWWGPCFFYQVHKKWQIEDFLLWFARTETYIWLYPCVERFPYFTLSIIKHHTRCLYLATSLCSLGEQPHKPKPSCISIVSCNAPSLGTFQGWSLQIIIIKSSSEQQGDKCLSSWLVSKLLQIVCSKSQKGADAVGEEQWLKKPWLLPRELRY